MSIKMTISAVFISGFFTENCIWPDQFLFGEVECQKEEFLGMFSMVLQGISDHCL